MKPLTALPILLLLAACSPQSGSDAPSAASANAASAAVPPPTANASAAATASVASEEQSSASWAGRYRGILPCAPCEGIETTLQLNADGSYRLTETYQQRHPLTEEVSGHFTWRREGRVLQLDKTGGERLYQVDNGQVWALDVDGKQVEGELAANYILKRTN